MITTEDIEGCEVFAIVKSTKAKAKPIILSVCTDDEVDGVREYLTTGTLEVSPTGVWNSKGKLEFKRQVACAFGPSGAGKSTIVSNYARIFHKMYPESKIYLLSRKNEIDPAFSDIEMEKIAIDDNLLDLDTQSEECGIEKNCLFIFDDFDTVPEKYLQNAVNNLLVDILQVGRARGYSCFITSHLITSDNNKLGKNINNEAHVIFIPRQGGNYSATEAYLIRQFGLNKKEIKNIFNCNSRWLTFYKNYPRMLLWNKGVRLL